MKRILSLILALLFLCSCAAAPKTGRVSEEELAKLREEFPYYDAVYYSMADFSDPIRPLFEGCLVVIEVTGEPYCTVAHFLYPEPFKDPADFQAKHPELNEKSVAAILTNMWQHVDATVVETIWSCTDIPVGETISLTFDRYLMPPDTPSVFQNNQRYVCYLRPYPSDVLTPEKPYYATKYYTWHLTKDDVVLSATSEPGPDSFSGLYLESFKQDVLNILNEE